jgi:multiple sugar transport system ATP-binding protein
VREPRALLLDEPLSALDALLRLEMRAELKRLQRDLGRTVVYVTHDQVEAMSMADRIAVLREGRVEQVATPEEVYNRPANRFVATVIGSPPMNFVHVRAGWTGEALELAHAFFRVRVDPLAAAPLRDRVGDGDECLVGVRPESVSVSANGGIPASVVTTEPLGGETVVDLDLGGRILKALVEPTLGLAGDESVRLELDGSRLHLFTAGGDALLSAGGDDLFHVQPA